MKNIIIGIALTTLLLGCSDRRDAQIKSLSERLTKLEADHAELSSEYYSNCVAVADEHLKIWRRFIAGHEVSKNQNEINRMLLDRINERK